jgi:hypothetical protein
MIAMASESTPALAVAIGTPGIVVGGAHGLQPLRW